MTDHKHDIEKYRSGALTPVEMHALEKKALTDPFLADALEGIESIESNELNSDLQQIQKALNKRIDDKKLISPWTWTYRIAAGLLLVAITTYFIINLTSDDKNENLALNKSETLTPETKALEQADVTKPKREEETATQFETQTATSDKKEETEQPKTKQEAKQEPVNGSNAMTYYDKDDSRTSGDASGNVDLQPAPTVVERAEDIQAYQYSTKSDSVIVTQSTPGFYNLPPDRAKRRQSGVAPGCPPPRGRGPGGHE